ncbi:MAG: aromatic amino acid ammonia-lyase [Bacteroidales bacterium]
MIILGKEPLTETHIRDIVFGKKKIRMDEHSMAGIKKNFAFLQSFNRDKIIYGINTGFGPMARYKIMEEDQMDLQYNLIRSHAAGSGPAISMEFTRASLLARLSSLLQGHSGIHPEVVERLADFLNLEIYPVIPEHGGVGASGDLVQLSHLALALIGEGEVFYRGEKRPAKAVLDECGLDPVSMHMREGLALINGTAVMTGIGIVNLVKARQLMHWSALASSLINELVESYDDHFSVELNGFKKHPGQKHIASLMRKYMEGSSRVRSRADHLYNGYRRKEWNNDKVQEFYSLRCVPQVLGPVSDTLEYALAVIVNEFNSVNDNPVIDEANGNVLHGGNFHGDYISLEMDKVKMAITKVSMLAERQLNYLMNDKLNEKWPPFVNLGKPGLNLGMQGVQFTATSTVAENQVLSNPVYVHSIPNNNDNQDIVSMGANAALMTARVIRNSYEVMAIEWMALLQAVDYLGCDKQLSGVSGKIYREMRTLVPRFEEDTTKYKEIERIKNYLLGQDV